MFANFMAKYGAPKPGNIGEGASAWNTSDSTNFVPPRGGKPGIPSYDAALAKYKATPK
jgi:hypothetical protein